MKRNFLFAAAIASVLGGISLAAEPVVMGTAIAQTRPDSTPAPAPSPAPAPALTPDQQAKRDRIKGERQTCRTEAQGKGVKGEALRQAVQDCMAKVDPVASKRMACVAAAHAQNLSGDAMRQSIHGCMTST